MVDLLDIEIDSELAKIISVETCERHKLVSFSKDEDILCVAMVNPQNIFTIEDIEFGTDLKVVPYLALPNNIEEIDNYTGTCQNFMKSLCSSNKKFFLSHENIAKNVH